jgi:uncharacterized protein YbjQ (UPF0145 family)
MIVTTTPDIQGKSIVGYLGVICAEAIIGANIVRDVFAGFTNIVGGRSAKYEEALQEARSAALAELQRRAALAGANAVVGVKVDYEMFGSGGSMMMVAMSGTAVKID